jgi:hypothetical protein
MADRAGPVALIDINRRFWNRPNFAKCNCPMAASRFPGAKRAGEAQKRGKKICILFSDNQ